MNTFGKIQQKSEWSRDSDWGGPKQKLDLYMQQMNKSLPQEKLL